jgi:hypothetical protein
MRATREKSLTGDEWGEYYSTHDTVLRTAAEDGAEVPGMLGTPGAADAHAFEASLSPGSTRCFAGADAPAARVAARSGIGAAEPSDPSDPPEETQGERMQRVLPRVGARMLSEAACHAPLLRVCRCC